MFRRPTLSYRFFFLLLLALVAPHALWAAAPGKTPAAIEQRVQNEVDKAPNNEAQWGIFAMDLATGAPVLSIDDQKLFMPASNRKLFSTAFDLDTLGADYRFATRLEYAGTIGADGTLNGDLIVRASGDPTISGRFRKDKTSTGVFEDWAAALASKGVRTVSGNLVADLSAFNADTKYGEGWSWEYADDYYSAPVGAFSFNENVVFVKVAPTGNGAPCSIALDPPNEAFIIQNNTKTRSGGDTVTVKREDGSNLIVVSGGLAEGHESEFNPITADDPASYAGETLLAVLKHKGIKVEGKLEETHVAPPATPAINLIAEYDSPPLAEILKVVNQSSNNNLAEMLYLDAGHVATNQPASYANSREAEMKFWQKIDLADAGRIYAADGSGLSRRNLFTPRAFCDLLRKMRQHKDSEAYLQSLAVAGRNGTLSGRMGNITGHVIGKTGTIANVSCLSGYLIDSNKKTLVFSMLVNQFTCSTSSIRATQDHLCQLLVNEPVDTSGLSGNDDSPSMQNGG